METRRKQDVTRQRLIEAAVRRFREHGYATTTAAAIAEDAGVTERTFYRYFPTKADALVANWEQHADVLREVLRTSDEAELIDVVRIALAAYSVEVRDGIGDAVESAIRVYNDRAAYLALMGTVLDVESDLATEIGRRTGRSADGMLVRVTANACAGVFRAAVRAALAEGDASSIPDLVDQGVDHLEELFDALTSRDPKR
jgi:AcrR family transcriptional regulator